MVKAICTAKGGEGDVHLVFSAALPHLAGVENSNPSHKDHQAHQRSEPQQVGVPAKPGKVQGHLLTKIAPGRKGEMCFGANKETMLLGVTRKCSSTPKGIATSRRGSAAYLGIWLGLGESAQVTWKKQEWAAVPRGFQQQREILGLPVFGL